MPLESHVSPRAAGALIHAPLMAALMRNVTQSLRLARNIFSHSCLVVPLLDENLSAQDRTVIWTADDFWFFWKPGDPIPFHFARQ
jgi:hypothetical protein